MAVSILRNRRAYQTDKPDGLAKSRTYKQVALFTYYRSFINRIYIGTAGYMYSRLSEATNLRTDINNSN